MILSQLVDTDDLMELTPDELRNLLAKLDDEVVYGSHETLLTDTDTELTHV
jgi:hypothetical protein